MLASLARSVIFCVPQVRELLVGRLDDLLLGLQDLLLLLEGVGRVIVVVQSLGQLGLDVIRRVGDMAGQAGSHPS